MDDSHLAPLSMEFADVAFGDLRLTRRLMSVVDAAAQAPGASLPERAGSVAALEATYRLLEHPAASPQVVLGTHVQCTVRRAEALKTVLVAHDTTEFEFGGEKLRDGLGWLHYEKIQGFLAHFSFCVSPTGEPLGTLGLYAWMRLGKSKGRRSQTVSQADPDRESLRWQESALLTDELLAGKTKAIHLMDREGDSYELIAVLIEHELHFVIRLCHDRRLAGGRESSECEKLFDSLSRAPFFFTREVTLSARGKNGRSGNLQTFPARASRLARLEVRAEAKEIFIGNGSPAHVPASLRLNFVEVREVNPPEGEDPVLWRLVTTEPVGTEAEVAAVVDAYCRRWMIEEFFKALKTGCRYEQRQLESGRALLVALAIECAVAWQMLLIRSLSRRDPEAPAARVVTETQLAILSALGIQGGKALPANPTVVHVLYAIAALGGHIKNNGPPGWLILRRGLDKLLTIEVGWSAAHAARVPP